MLLKTVIFMFTGLLPKLQHRDMLCNCVLEILFHLNPHYAAAFPKSEILIFLTRCPDFW